MSLPTPEGVAYGLVVGRWVQIVGDTSEDPDKLPDTKAVAGTAAFTRKVKTTIRQDSTQEDGSYVGIAKQSITGYLRTSDGELAVSADDDTTGLWLVTGVYNVVFTLNGTTWPSFDFEVLPTHTSQAPLDLITATPYVPPVGATPVTIMVPASIPNGYLLAKQGDSVIGVDPLLFDTKYVPFAIVSDTPSAPPEGTSRTYFVSPSVMWPEGLVWSIEPDGGLPPVLTNLALVSLFTHQSVTRAVLGATFPIT